ncbi:hypothetical protein MOB18_21880 [Bacillus inaquosorum]|uniref:hypothetical protein n=1 Tax=Bacillus inaquosorum TaxID=483913 RepID=UPI00227FA70F|nr:hypothetical protein [Bacillus inaquosorum]MCY7751710.1 hypothetical protein [Bacillus inaquosorum]
MQKEDPFTAIAKLNEKDFEQIIKEQRSKDTRAANILADSFEATRKAFNDEKLKGN